MTKINEKEIIELGNKLLKCPELGYKEFKTKEILVEYLKEKGFKIENECFNTAFSVSIGKGHPHIGLIAELDGIPTLGHKYVNKDDSNAAHACGHNTQCAIMCGVISALKNEKFNGKVTLFFTPAEEFTDITYREKLIKQKKIKYIGGKINMIEKGIFDDVDLVYHLHSMGGSKYKLSVNSDLGGFVYKKITFNGRAAHGAVAPHLGINALNEYALFNDAINKLRETFKDEDQIRIHGIVSEGGQTVNSIPERVVYECYVRSMNPSALIDVANKVDNAAKHCAKALGGSATIKTKPGYLPFIQNRQASEIVYKEMLKLVDINDIENGVGCMAAGDIGDVSIFRPAIQIGYGGFVGVPHGKDFMVKNEDITYSLTSKVIINSVLALLKDSKFLINLKKNYEEKMTKKEWLNYINQLWTMYLMVLAIILEKEL